MTRRLARRVLLLGWSGADWEVIRPLLDAGRMPHLEQLVDAGTMGGLATLRPVVSPMLWTSMITGKRADEHGVLGHVEVRPDGAGTRPPASTSLRARPLWQILGDHGLASAVVGWDATHPARAVGGIAVSNQYRIAQGTAIGGWPLPPNSVAPTSLHDVMRRLRVHPHDLAAEQIAYFVPGTGTATERRDDRSIRLATLLAQTATDHAAGTWLAEHAAWDLLAVQYGALDGVSREYDRVLAATGRPENAERPEPGDGVVERMYQFYDLMLGRYMRLVGPETTIVIVSEHGMATAWRPGPADGPATAEMALAYRPYGVLVACGPGIARDQLVFGAGVLDVTPTILVMLGLPVGRDMEGRVLARLFAEPVEPSHVDSHGAPDVTEVDGDEDPRVVEEAIRHLEGLGYARGLAGEADGAIEEARFEQTFNLAETHFARGRWREAADLFASALDRRPSHAMAKYRLVQCRLRLGDVEGGRRLAGDFLSHDVDSPWAQIALGQIDALEARWEAALERFERAHAGASDARGAHYRRGAVRLQQKRWAEAETAFREALDADGEGAATYHALGLALHGQRRHAEAAEMLMRSIGLVYHQPIVHFHLGAALCAAGYLEAAIESLRTALQSRPDLADAHGILARILRTKGDLLGAARHEAASAALRGEAAGR